ncbi:MAG TPA: PHP domain-containing protein [Candidatus Obscuribacterales bacterium]
MRFDLHLHTHHSDGNWSPAELVEHAIKLKLTHVAITDHDTVSGIREAEEAARDRLIVIPGVEINTIWTNEDGRREDVHILGYFIDDKNPALLKLLKKQRQARMDHIRSFILRLKEEGIELSIEAIERCAGEGSIGKAHITEAIVEAGLAPDTSEAYEKFLTRNSPYFVERASVTPEEAIDAINSAGGLSSIAHPGKGEHMKHLILHLKSRGLSAIEAFHRIHSVDVVKSYIRFANRNSLLITGGSDCHGPYGEFPPSIGSIKLPEDILRDLIAASGRQKVPV